MLGHPHRQVAKLDIVPRLPPRVRRLRCVLVERKAPVVGKAALDANPDLGKSVASLMSDDAANTLGSTIQVFNGNLKATPPNDIIKADSDLVASAKPRALVRWWEAVPSQIQGDLVAAMGSFMFDPTPATAQKVMGDMQKINADYWASK